MAHKDIDPPDLSGGASKHGTISAGWTAQALGVTGQGGFVTGYYLTAPQAKVRDDEQEGTPDEGE